MRDLVMEGIVHADCLGPDGLASLADRSVDHVITDPPYSERVHARLGKEGRKDGHAPRVELAFGCLSDIDALAVALQCARICRAWILVFCDELSFGVWVAALEAARCQYVRQGVWVKTNPMPQMSGDRPCAGVENIVIAHAPRPPKSGRMRWNGGGKPATYTGDNRWPAERAGSTSAGEKRVHPTQKPLWLMEALVRDFSSPGELVLDPFAGSGTTGVACKRMGRRFLGFEAIEKYAAVARARLDECREQMDLLGPRMVEGR